MPCCNANLKNIDVYKDVDGDNLTKNIKAIPNYDRCLNQSIDGFIFTNGDIDLNKLKPKTSITLNLNEVFNKLKNNIVREITLDLNNLILVINKRDKDKCFLIKITSNGGVIMDKFTDTQIPFINGIKFNVENLNISFLAYKRKNSVDNLFYVRNISNDMSKIKDVKTNYILGKENSQLPKGKLGVLVDKLDILLNSQLTSIIKGTINYEKYKIEATQDHVNLYNEQINKFLKEVDINLISTDKFIEKREEYLQKFYREVGTPDKEHIESHKKGAYLIIKSTLESSKQILKFEVGDRLILIMKDFEKGTEQNSKYSIFTPFQNIRNIDDIELFLALLFDILTPELFLQLNCGEIFKTFSNTSFNYQDKKKYYSIYWCRFYGDFVDKYFSEFKHLTLLK